MPADYDDGRVLRRVLTGALALTFFAGGVFGGVVRGWLR